MAFSNKKMFIRYSKSDTEEGVLGKQTLWVPERILTPRTPPLLHNQLFRP